MLAPTEERWIDRFLPPKPPQLTLRCSGGVDDDGVLFVNGQLVARGPVHELTDRAEREFHPQPGDVFTLELVASGQSATCRLRSPEERAAGVKVVIAEEPLNEGDDSVNKQLFFSTLNPVPNGKSNQGPEVPNSGRVY